MQILNVSVMFMFHQVNLPVISTLVESMDELQSSTLFTNVSWHYSIRLCNISHSQISASYTPKTRIQTLSNERDFILYRPMEQLRSKYIHSRRASVG